MRIWRNSKPEIVNKGNIWSDGGVLWLGLGREEEEGLLLGI